MNTTPDSVATGVPAGARFAFNGILTSKRVCQEFLREFGIKRDWKNTSLAEMQSMLKKVEHPKMFLAAQRLCERSGDDFIPQLYMVGPSDTDDSDDSGQEVEAAAPQPPPRAAPRPKPAPTPAPQATQNVEAVKVEKVVAAVEAVEAKHVKPSAAPATDKPATDQPQSPASPVSAQQLAGVAAAVKRQVTEQISTQLGTEVRQSLSQLVDKAVEKAAAKLVPTPRELVVKTATSRVKLEGVQHKEFDKLVKSCAARLPDGHRLNIWLYGPPGTGKTTAARNAAKALGLPFATTGSLLTKYDITGFISAVGKLVRSPFREIWEKGGVFLLDEIDGSDPRAIVAFNAALANAVMAFPDKMVERHKDCVMIAAANTAGMGATAEFNGRVKLDQASMDRFVVLNWPIDEAIERAGASDAAWLETVHRVRANVQARGIKGVCISPRATFYGCALLETGLPLATVKDMVLKKGMSAEQWQMVQ